MRPVWKGAISFGLVNIPVNLYSAEDPSDLKLKMLDSNDHAGIKYQRVNENTGKEVAWDDIVKAYEFEDGSYVIVEDDDYEKADPKASKTLDIEQFVPIADVDPMYLEKPYYLAPSKGGEKPYVLLREAMEKSGKAAIGRVTLRTKQSIGMIVPQGNALVMIRMRYFEEVRKTDKLDLPEDTKVSEKEMKLALTLIEGLSQEWDPEEFKDEYSNALLKRLEAKARLKGDEELEEKEEEEEVEASNVVDIMELLRKSVETRGSKKKAVGENTKSTAKNTKGSSRKESDNKTTAGKRKSS